MKKMNEQEILKRRHNIREMKKQLSAPRDDLIKPFTKYKVLTYMFNIVLPPYGLYRVWNKKSEFCLTEQIAQSMICIVYSFMFMAKITL